MYVGEPDESLAEIMSDIKTQWWITEANYIVASNIESEEQRVMEEIEEYLRELDET